MKRRITVVVTVLSLTGGVIGQGLLRFSNPTAPTHLWSIDGPLAGPPIYAQLRAGPTPDSLTPVGVFTPHLNSFAGVPTGHVNGPTALVPGIGCQETAYVRMVAWDSTLWGTSLAQVPANQLGTTDTIAVSILCDGFGPIETPLRFNQSAVVPVPEPAGAVLATLGVSVLLVLRGRHRQ